MTKAALMANIKIAEDALESAKNELAQWEARPENNRFDTLEAAEVAIEDALMGEAAADCEGSYNCGAPQYSRGFMVGEKLYMGILDVEYNRHDKTYYYIDGHDFRVEEQVPA